jgi:hypothetical protein
MRAQIMPPAILSTIAQKVARRTVTAETPCPIWKAAESASRCGDSREGLKRLTEAPGSLSALISAAYGSLQYKELERPKGIANNSAPKGKELGHNGIVIMHCHGQAIVTFRNTTASRSGIRGLCQSANRHKCKRTSRALISWADCLAWNDQDAL